MKMLGIFAMLLGAAFGFFHIVRTGAGFTVVPKASFTFVDTFTSVGDVIRRYNNRSFAEALRGDPQLDNLVRGLEKQDLISSSKKSDSEPQGTKGSGKANCQVLGFFESSANLTNLLGDEAKDLDHIIRCDTCQGERALSD